jgi:uncharacterized membrane protein
MAAIATQPIRGIFRTAWLLVAMLVAVLLVTASPALAHKKHKEKQAFAEQVVQPGEQPVEPATMHGGPSAMHSGPSAMHGQMGETMEELEKDRSNMSFVERLMDWLGRTHPVIVHFPIAFFPAALVTALVGRRQPAFGAPVQFLVIAGGVIGPAAALLGWFDGGFNVATDDWLLQFHRWLGTAIGLGALGLAIWAWRKPDANRGPAMIAGLAVITIAIIGQGWFGGAMVHGVDHMNW